MVAKDVCLTFVASVSEVKLSWEWLDVVMVGRVSDGDTEADHDDPHGVHQGRATSPHLTHTVQHCNPGAHVLHNSRIQNGRPSRHRTPHRSPITINLKKHKINDLKKN